MQIAVISDSHDNIWNLRKVIKIIVQKNCKMIIHCGDFISPFMLKELDKASIPVHGVFGNNDGDHFKATQMSLTELENITFHGHKGEIEIDGISICLTHYKDIAEGLAATNKYDVVCFGHTHKYYQNKVGKTLLLNPGEVMGKDGSPGFCIMNTESFDIERVELTQHPEQ